MRWRRAAGIFLVTVVAAGCGTATQYRNDRNPGRNLTSDMTDCRNMSQVPLADRFGAEYSRTTYVVDDEMLTRCLAERGWQPITDAPPRR